MISIPNEFVFAAPWLLPLTLVVFGVWATSTALIVSSLVGAGASTAVGVYGAKKQNEAAKRAADVQERANTEAIEFERDNEQRRREEWDKTIALQQAQWDALEKQREPWRRAGEAALADLMRRAGYTFDSGAAPAAAERPNFDRPMPENWKPGDPTGLEPPTPRESSETAPRRSLLDNPQLMPPSRYDGAATRSVDDEPTRPNPLPSIMPARAAAAPVGEISEAAYADLADRVPLGALMRPRPRPMTRRV